MQTRAVQILTGDSVAAQPIFCPVCRIDYEDLSDSKPAPSNFPTGCIVCQNTGLVQLLPARHTIYRGPDPSSNPA